MNAENIACVILPFIMTVCAIMPAISKDDLFPLFLTGCKDGLKTILSVFPTLLLLVVAVRMLSASGALDAVCTAATPFLSLLGIPSDMIPVMITRPISGSGATATVKELFSSSGADGFSGFAASVLLGSTDTIIYTVSMYFSHINEKKTGYTLPVSFAVFMFCTVISCFVTKLCI